MARCGAGRLDLSGGVSFAPTGCREGPRGGLRGRRYAVDLGAVGLGRGSGRTQSSPGGGSARMVPRRPSRERGSGGSEVRQGDASGALPASADTPEEGEEPGCAPRTGGVGGREPRRFGGVARDPRPEEARRSTTLGLATMSSGRGVCRWKSGAIESTIRRVINLRLKGAWGPDGGERGGGVPTSGRGRLGSVGRRSLSTSGGDGPRSSQELALDAS